MRIRLIRKHRRALITSTLLVTLLWRALIPVGFMPAADGSAALMICPEGMPDMVIGHDAGHAHGSDYTEHCPFGAAPFAAPLPAITIVATPAGELAPAPAQRSESLHLVARSTGAHQPRAPPVA